MISIPHADSRFSSLLLASLLVVLLACGSGGTVTDVGGGSGGGGGDNGGSGGRTTNIDMTSNLTFVPKIDTVTAGQTVTWTTQGSPSHTTTSDSPGLWDSGDVAAGESFSHTFSDTGTFPYHCTYHQGAGMVGTIVVIAP